MKRWRLSAAIALLLMQPASALADGEPAIVYSVGGKFDGSFNESAFRGVTRFREETGLEVREFEIDRDAQSIQALRNFAKRGQTPIVAIGFNQASAVAEAAKDFPESSFAIIDMVVDAPNVASYVFRENEGAYIAGLLAAKASKTGVVGFVGGMDIPIIRRFLCGYQAGVNAVDPTIQVLYNMAGDTPAAFADPVRGAELARGQIEAGADVIIQAAGGTGIGVLQASADADVLGIGTDSNQNALHPGNVLTSIRKRVDNAVHDSFTAARNGSFKPGIRVLGLAEGGMDWVIDDNNRNLISADMKAAADEAVSAISSGELKVHDILSDGPCPHS